MFYRCFLTWKNVENLRPWLWKLCVFPAFLDILDENLGWDLINLIVCQCTSCILLLYPCRLRKLWRGFCLCSELSQTTFGLTSLNYTCLLQDHCLTRESLRHNLRCRKIEQCHTKCNAQLTEKRKRRSTMPNCHWSCMKHATHCWTYAMHGSATKNQYVEAENENVERKMAMENTRHMEHIYENLFKKRKLRLQS